MLTRIVLIVIAFFFAICDAHAGSWTFTPEPYTGKDAEIVDGDKADTNFGNFSEFKSNWTERHSVGLIEFDYPLAIFIPDEAVITSAKLRLWQAHNEVLGQQYDIFRITSPWQESSVTFNTAPSFDPVARSSLVIPDNSRYAFRSWNVTELVKGWVDGDYANYGMRIEANPLGGNGTAFFASSDAELGYRPSLEVVWAVPEPATLAISLGMISSGILVMRRRIPSRRLRRPQVGICDC